MSKSTFPGRLALSDQINVPGDFVPLFVDLDGTLIKTDLLIESAFFLLKKTALDFVRYVLLASAW